MEFNTNLLIGVAGGVVITAGGVLIYNWATEDAPTHKVKIDGKEYEVPVVYDINTATDLAKKQEALKLEEAKKLIAAEAQKEKKSA